MPVKEGRRSSCATPTRGQNLWVIAGERHAERRAAMIKHRRCSCSGGAVCCDIEQGFPLCIVLKSTSLRLLAVMTNDHRATHSRVAPEERRSRNHFDVEASKGVMKGWRAQKAARAYLGQRDRGRQRPNTPTPASMSSRPIIGRRRPVTAGDASREKCPHGEIPGGWE